MKTTNKELENFVPFPRQVYHDLLDGKLTPNEYEVYVRIRHSATPYGIAIISIEGILSDFHHRGWKDKSTVNKILLSLKQKRYLGYDRRAGRRGSFDIYFPEFKIPNGGVTILIDDNNSPVRGGNSTPPLLSPEVEQTLPTSNQRLEDIKASSHRLVDKMSLNSGRTSYTDNDIETDTNNRFSKKGIPVNTFTPTSYEEHVCREIAIEIGDETMDFLLGTLQKRGLSVIERARGIFREEDKSKMRNKGAYFNAIVTDLVTRFKTAENGP